MKHSIKKIFNNLSVFLVLSTLVSALACFFIFEEDVSFEKMKNLNNQKNIIASLTKLKKNDIDIALIKFNGKSNELFNEIQKLHTLYQKDYSGNYILNNSQEYLSDLKRLKELTKAFNTSAKEFYTNDISKEEKKTKDINLQNAFYNINSHINNLIYKNIIYEEKKLVFLKIISIVLVILLVLITFWYKKRLNSIYKDIQSLYAIDLNRQTHHIFSEEVDAISLRMKKKPTTTQNPDMIDPVTKINNHKGMLSSYYEKKGMKSSNFTTVTVFEIDNFSKTNRVYEQQFVQSVLRKIAFSLSLHEQATDVIARTDYNQFTIILSRPSKEQSFKEINVIHQSLAEIKLKSQKGDLVDITTCAGFMVKPNNQHLDEILKKTHEILHHAQKMGHNQIAQISDLAEHGL